MKKPTLKQWMKHAEKRNPYVFDPKTKLEFVKPRSITMLDEIKPWKKMKIDTTVTIRVPMTKKEVTAYVGTPCKDYEAECPTCKAWGEWSLSYRYVFLRVNRADLVALMMKGEV
jgi:hypothetical protein